MKTSNMSTIVDLIIDIIQKEIEKNDKKKQ